MVDNNVGINSVSHVMANMPEQSAAMKGGTEANGELKSVSGSFANNAPNLASAMAAVARDMFSATFAANTPAAGSNQLIHPAPGSGAQPQQQLPDYPTDPNGQPSNPFTT